MPNIYYSTPSMGLASATQGFLSSLKDFKQLDLQEKALEARTKSEEESQRLREREADLREQGLELSRLREERLAQPKYDPQLAQGAIEMMHEGIMEHMPGADYIRAQLTRGKMNPLEAIDRVEAFREDYKYRNARKEKLSEVSTEGRTKIKELKKLGYSPSDLIPLDMMLSEVTGEAINQDINPWIWEDEFAALVGQMQMAADVARVMPQQPGTPEAPTQPTPSPTDSPVVAQPPGPGNSLVSPIPGDPTAGMQQLKEALGIFNYLRKIATRKGAPKEVKGETEAFIDALTEGLEDEPEEE